MLGLLLQCLDLLVELAGLLLELLALIPQEQGLANGRMVGFSHMHTLEALLFQIIGRGLQGGFFVVDPLFVEQHAQADHLGGGKRLRSTFENAQRRQAFDDQPQRPCFGSRDRMAQKQGIQALCVTGLTG